MLRAFCIILLFSLVVKIHAQEVKAPPVILQGKLENTIKRELVLFVQNKPGQIETDTIRINEDGTFYHETNIVRMPQRTSLQIPGLYNNEFFVAPGFNLNITADAKDWVSINETLHFEGVGSKSNRFRLTPLSVYNQGALPHNLTREEFVYHLDTLQRHQDSLLRVHYPKEGVNDPYYNEIRHMLRLNTKFKRLYSLLTFARHKEYSYRESVRFVRQNFDNSIWSNIKSESWMISWTYRTLVLPRLQYLDRIRGDYNPEGLEVMDIMVNEYPAMISNYLLYRYMTRMISSSDDWETLVSNSTRFVPYYKYYTDSADIDLIYEKLKNKSNYLLKQAIGTPAPPFNLYSFRGDTISITDLAGKVILIDFWASWCAPRRKEATFLHQLYAEFDKSKFEIVGIAVNDNPEKWMKAIAEDKTNWTHLFDFSGEVRDAYAASVLPRYVVIDSKGYIVDFAAPKPSETEKLTSIIRQAIRSE